MQFVGVQVVAVWCPGGFLLCQRGFLSVCQHRRFTAHAHRQHAGRCSLVAQVVLVLRTRLFGSMTTEAVYRTCSSSTCRSLQSWCPSGSRFAHVAFWQYDNKGGLPHTHIVNVQFAAVWCPSGSCLFAHGVFVGGMTTQAVYRTRTSSAFRSFALWCVSGSCLAWFFLPVCQHKRFTRRAHRQHVARSCRDVEMLSVEPLAAESCFVPPYPTLGLQFLGLAWVALLAAQTCRASALTRAVQPSCPRRAGHAADASTFGVCLELLLSTSLGHLARAPSTYRCVAGSSLLRHVALTLQVGATFLNSCRLRFRRAASAALLTCAHGACVC
jgi:hypothetical protein